MSKEIKFKHARGGVTPILEGNTVFTDLWPIAAVDISIDGEALYKKDSTYELPTDEDGLKALIERGNDCINNLNSASLALSMVLTDEGLSDQVQENLTELAWLQASLIEIAIRTGSSVDKMRDVLEAKKPN